MLLFDMALWPGNADRITYSTATGQLFWTADDSKAGGVSGVLFATLDKVPTLSSADFFFV